MVKLILYNGKLTTQDPNTPHATALAIGSKHVLAAGSDADILALASPQTRLIDLSGRRVLPGLIDSHFHYWHWALSARWINLADTVSLPELYARVKEAANKLPPGEWILGQGWNETRWANAGMPNRMQLDNAAPNNPVILWRIDMHVALTNSLALQKAGITKNSDAPVDGVIDHDDTGHPTGFLRELAVNLVSDVIPQPTEEETVQAMREGFGTLHRLGLTGIHDFRIMGGADGIPAFRAWQRLQATGEKRLRVWMDLAGERLSEAISLGLRTGLGDSFFRVGHLKLFVDGSQGARTAWLSERYEDAEYGLALIPPDELRAIIRRADNAGISVAIHAIGDRANHEVLNIFEQIMASERCSITAPPVVPHRIEHVQLLQTEDIARLARLGIVASVQPIHVTDDYPMIETSVGQRAQIAWRFRDMLEAGVKLAFGSDCPTADPNPMWGIHAAVTRRRRDGIPSTGWYPNQCLTVSEAVWGYTMGSALVSGREAELGSLSPGKFADLIVLDRDIFTINPMEIAQTQVMMTIFDGQVVYGD